MRPGVDNLADLDVSGWERQYQDLQAIAEGFRQDAEPGLS